MRAIAIVDFGVQPTLHDLAQPEPGDGEVLVRVKASSVNGFDVAVANGYLEGMMEHRFPVVLGKDFAGTVEAIGADVDWLEAGDEVFGVVMKPYLGDGGFDEYVATAAAFVAKIPAGVSIEVAGASGLAGATALDLVDALTLTGGEKVLVSGATGGVGGFAIQLLQSRGVSVIATTSDDDDEEFLRGLGADAIVNYREDLASAGRPEAIIHLAGDGVALAELCGPGGRIVSAVGLTSEQVGNPDVEVTPVTGAPTTENLDRLAAAVASGNLTVPISRSYDLADVPAALGDFATGARGKLGISIA